MKIRPRAKSPQFQKRDALKTQTYYRGLFGVAITLVPQTTIGFQQFGMFLGETIKAWTTQTIFSFDEKAQRYREFAKSLLIGLDRSESGHQITFAIGGAARIQLS